MPSALAIGCGAGPARFHLAHPGALSKRAFPCRHKRRWPRPRKVPPAGARAADWFEPAKYPAECPEHSRRNRSVEKFGLRGLCEGRQIDSSYSPDSKRKGKAIVPVHA